MVLNLSINTCLPSISDGTTISLELPIYSPKTIPVSVSLTIFQSDPSIPLETFTAVAFISDFSEVWVSFSSEITGCSSIIEFSVEGETSSTTISVFSSIFVSSPLFVASFVLSVIFSLTISIFSCANTVTGIPFNIVLIPISIAIANAVALFFFII